MSEKIKRLFISYAHQDRAHAKHIVEMLRVGGHNPWFDNDLTVGSQWTPQLHDEIRRCDVFVYILTPKSVKSEWCQWEFYEAIKLGKPIVPVLVKKTQLTDALRRIHHIDFTGTTDERNLATARLIHALQNASPILSRDEIPSRLIEPSGPPEHMLGKPGFFGRETRSHLPAAEEVTSLPDEETEELHQGKPLRPANRRTGRRALIWPLVIALIIVGVTVLIRYTLMPPVAPQVTMVLTQEATQLVLAPTDPSTITPSPETPIVQPSDTPQPVVPTGTPTTETPSKVLQPTVVLLADVSTPAPITAVVNSRAVNLRSGPGQDYAIKGTASPGDQLTVLAQSLTGWLLVEDAGGKRGWVANNLVTVSTVLSLIPMAGAATLPPAPHPGATASAAQICNPGEWDAVCGSNNCGLDYVSECNSAGTGYSCVWNPAQCSISGGPSWPPAMPPVHIPNPGEPIPTAFQCTQSWLDGQIQAYGASQNPPLNLQQTKALLISQGYDRNHNGDIDCDDYRA